MQNGTRPDASGKHSAGGSLECKQLPLCICGSCLFTDEEEEEGLFSQQILSVLEIMGGPAKHHSDPGSVHDASKDVRCFHRPMRRAHPRVPPSLSMLWRVMRERLQNSYGMVAAESSVKGSDDPDQNCSNSQISAEKSRQHRRLSWNLACNGLSLLRVSAI